MDCNYSRFVVLVGSPGEQTSYVLDGTTSLAEAFGFINERRLLGKVDSIQVYVDEAIQKPWSERYFPNSPHQDAETSPS